MPGDNPFNAGPGLRPATLIGREPYLDAVGTALATARMPGSQPLAISGRVLTGRSVLLDAFAEHSNAAGWPTFSISVGRSQSLGEAMAAVFEARTGAAMPRPEVRRVLRGMVGLLEDESCPGVALFVDDIDRCPMDQAVEFIDLLSQAMRNELPVVAAVSSLPGWPDALAPHLGSESGLTTLPLTTLSPDDVRAGVVGPALAAGVAFEPDAVTALVRRCRGIPALVQMLARHAVAAAHDGRVTAETVAAASVEAEHDAVATYFRPLHDRLTPSQRRFLRALRQAGEGAGFDDVRRHLGEFTRLDTGASPARAARDELIAAGAIYVLDGERLHFSVAGYEPFIDTVD